MGMASRTVPVTYINSAAAIKSFVGERGGTVCTSSNAAAVLEWGWRQQREDPVHARPASGPQHGVLPAGRAARPDGGVGSASSPSAGSPASEVEGARLILWKGHCSVHVRFTAKQIAAVRSEHPGVRVIVHPEVPFEVVRGGRRQRLDRVHPVAGARRARPGRSGRWAPRCTSCTGWPPRWRPRASPCCRSISWAACARRCSASRPTTCCGCSRAWSTARCTTRWRCPSHQIRWGRVALDRMLQIH